MKANKSIKRVERIRADIFSPWMLLLLCDDGFSFSVVDSKANRRAYAIGRSVSFAITPT